MSNNLFLHEEQYRGENLVDRLQHWKIVVCGVGALGSHLVDTLTRQGFTNLLVCDMDRVERHNISTQLYTLSDVGALKVNALSNKVFESTQTEIETFSKKVTSKNIKKVCKGASIVIDTFDNSESRQVVTNYGANTPCPLPCLHGGLFEDYGEVIWNKQYKVPKDVGGDVCEYPLARNLISLTVAMMAEEILSVCIGDARFKNWSVTLKDLQIRDFK
jgi:molybdopterin/thiamine biosynthesis adenylyltransferase